MKNGFGRASAAPGQAGARAQFFGQGGSRRLLLGTALTGVLAFATPAFAQSVGGTGGNGNTGIAGQPGGAYGTAGTAGTSSTVGLQGAGGGGGGGSGAAGGTGGNDSNGFGGGMAGAAGGGTGGIGGSPDAAGGGGGGGTLGQSFSTGAYSAWTVTGGTGGGGGIGINGGGGGGGSGGSAGATPGSATVSFDGTVGANTLQGGTGGVGGSSITGAGGSGGAGGAGFTIQGTGSSLTLSGTPNPTTITGGTGGQAGFGPAGNGTAGAGGAGIESVGSFSSILVNTNVTVTGGAGAASLGGGNTGGTGGAGIVGATLKIINAGTISGGAGGAANGGTAGAAGNALTFTGGANTLTTNGGTLTGNIAVGTLTTGSLDLNQTSAAGATGSATYANVITGGGSVSITTDPTKSVTLNAANLYSGGTTINANSNLVIGNAAAMGSGATNFAGSGSTLTSTVSASVANTLTVSNGVTATIGATGANTLTLGGVSFDTSAGNVALHFGSSTNTGTVVLNAASTASATTNSLTVDGGTLRLGNSAAAAVVTNSQAGVTVGTSATAATLDLNGNATTVTNLTGTASGLITNSSATPTILTANNTANSTYSGVIQDGNGAVSLTKTGTGTLILSGPNTYSGATAINGGTLQGGATNAFSGASALSVNSGATADLGGFNQAVASLAGAGTVTNSGTGGTTQTLTVNGEVTTFSGAITDGTTNKTGLAVLGTGNLTLSGAGLNTYSGPTTIGDGVNPTAISGGATNAFSANSAFTVNTASVLNLNGFGQTIASLAGAGTVSNFGGSNAVLTIGGAATTTFSGTISDGASRTGLTQAGTGTLILSGANTYSGGTTLSSGTIQVGNNSALGTGTVTFNGGTLQSGPANYTLANNIQMTSAGGTIVAAAGDVITFNGNITDGAGASAGTLTFTNSGGVGGIVLNGTNTYSAATNITFDTVLAAGSAGALSSNSNYNVNGALELTGLSNTIGALSGTGTGLVRDISATPATLTVGATNQSANFGGTIQDGIGQMNLTKVGTGTQILSGSNTYTGVTTVNGGALEVANGGSITASSQLLNSANFQVDSGASATFTGTGSTNNSGAQIIVGTAPTAASLTFNNDLTNNGFVTVNSSGTLNVNGLFTNNGTITNYGTVNDDLTNPGTLNNFGTYNVTGTLTNSGTINMVNGSPTNVVNVTGNYVATGGSTLNVDTTLTSGGAADQLRVAGTVTGNTVVNFNDVGAKGYFATPIVVVQSGGGAGTFTAGTGLGSAGIVNYSLQRIGNNFDIVATLNPGAAPTFATSIAASLAAVNVGFFQNASAFISAPPDPKPNQVGGGPWIRVAEGRNDVSAVGTTQNVGGATTANSLVRTTFNGFQTGVDLGLFNVENTGYNLHFGVTGGQVLLSAYELQSGINSSEVTIPFVGFYGAFTGHNFFTDFLVRWDFYNMKLTNPTALLSDANLNANGFSANGSIGYRYDVTKQFFIEPSLAVLYSKLNVNNLQVGIDPANNVYGTLSFSPIDSLIGRAGVRVGTNYSFQTFAVQPFLTGSVWHEFEGDTTSNFSAAGGNVPISVSRIGTFEQVGLGIAGQVLNTGLLGFFRGDYRFGENIHGYALNAGLRYQF